MGLSPKSHRKIKSGEEARSDHDGKRTECGVRVTEGTDLIRRAAAASGPAPTEESWPDLEGSELWEGRDAEM